MARGYTGNDNYGKPKSAYLEKLAEMDVTALADECEQMIWLSAFASNNPRSDYHWQVDACYDECVSRNRKDVYESAYKRASAT